MQGWVLILVLMFGWGGLAKRLAGVPGMVDAGRVTPGLVVELKYASRDNLVRRNLYGGLRRCFLQKDAARMLGRAAAALKKLRPDLHLLAHDCARPLSVQRQLWRAARALPPRQRRAYVADPGARIGSMHTYGCAVDLTLAGEDGRALEMGTPVDGIGRKAQPRHELALFRAGRLTAEQLANRLLLRLVMVRAGWLPLRTEWWHFSCAPHRVAHRRYPKIP
jgi:D-alanyl-D-alanine dipeptidase